MTAVARKLDDALPPGWARCRVCADAFDAHHSSSARNCPRHKGQQGTEEPLFDSLTRYVDDPIAQLFLSAFPDGATCEAIGEAMCLSRARVQQLEYDAGKKLRARLKLAGLAEEDVRDYFASRSQTTTRKAPRGPYRQRAQPVPVTVYVVDPESVVHAESLEVLGWYCDLEAVEEVGEIVVRASEVDRG